jgi:hypothetical protein
VSHQVPKEKGGTGKRFPRPACQHRRTPFEFSCGNDIPRALLVRESLKEGEKEIDENTD